jgi:serine/threonine protein phosphatase PrpC
MRAEDAFLVVASDGLWEFISGKDVARVLDAARDEAAAAAVERSAAVELWRAEAETVVAAGGEPPAPPDALNEESPAALQLALDALAEAAVSLWTSREGSVDDLSILIAELGAAEAQ